MNLGDIVSRLTVGVQRDDLASQYTSIVNEALTEIQRRRSWLVMHSTAFFTIPNGSSSIALTTDDNGNPTRFKEFTAQQTPVHLQSAIDGVLVPCEVWTREKVLRRQARLISNSLLYSVYAHPNTTRRVSVPVFLDWQGSGGLLVPSLNVLFAADSNLPFSVSYYGYLPDLADNSDQNYFTINYPEMVVDKAKAIAFSAINDPMTENFEELFEAKFKPAAAQDAYQAVAGLEIRM